MTSLFSVIAHEDANDQSKLRQAMALAHQRVEDRFGAFVRKGSIEDQSARYSLVEEDIRAVVAAACEQVGYADVDGTLAFIGKNFINVSEAHKIASTVHESRKPKMCPYHSEVTDISLAQGEAQAGFNAMAQHAWSDRHCQGEGYKGDKCKFKPAMTTQAFWDTKAEKAEQKRQERVEREEQRLEQEQIQESVTEDVPEDTEVPAAAEPVDIVEHSEPSAIGDGATDDAAAIQTAIDAVPMAMAASTKTAETAVPKMDKSKWTPKSVPELDADDDDGRWPTRRKDVTAPVKMDQGSRFDPSELKEIGGQVTERQDVTEKGGPAKTDQGGTFGGGERSAVSGLLTPGAIKEALERFKK